VAVQIQSPARLCPAGRGRWAGAHDHTLRGGRPAQEPEPDAVALGSI